MNKEIGLKLIITGDGKVAVVAANEVKVGIAGLAAEANKASAAIQAMTAAMSSSKSYDSTKLTAGMNAAGQAATALQQKTIAQNAALQQSDAIYAGLVSKLTLSTSAYRAQELALQGLSNKQIQHIQQLEKQQTAASGVTNQLAGLAAGYLSINAAIGTAKSIINTNIEMERLRAALTSTMGSIDKGRDAFQFIQDFATKTPYEVKGLTETFVMLKNMGLEPSQKVMEAMTNQSSKLGGSQETLRSIALQLGQAYSKGKLQQEDMIILAERGVPVYDLLAKVTGKNADELMDMSEKGTLTRDIIDQLITKMGELSSGANATAMDTLGGKLSNLADEITRAKDAMLESRGEHLLGILIEDWTYAVQGFRDFIKGQNPLDEINAQIDDARANVGKSRTRAGVDPEATKLAMLEEQRAVMMAEEIKRNEVTKTAAIYDETEKWYQEAVAKTVAVKKEHIKTSHGLTDAQKIENQAARELAQQQARYQAMREGASPDTAFIATIEQYTAAYNQGALSLQEYIYWLDQLDSKRNQGNAAQYNIVNQPKAEAPIVQWTTEMRDANASDVTKELDAYNKKIDEANTKTLDLGSVTSAVFDGALGGISSMAGAFSSMVDSINENTAAMDELNKKKALNAYEPSKDKQDENAKKYAAEELRLTEKTTEAKINGARQIAGAVSAQLKKGSDAQKAAHAIEMGLAGIQMAMQINKLIGIGAVTAAETASVAPAVAASTAKGTAKAAEAVATQATAGPYIGFALMAAMAVAMAALGFNTGGGGTVAIPQANPQSPDSGTVLGDPTAKSESIGNLANLLDDIHAKEYRELRGINEGVWKLSSGITDAVTKLFQNGGVKDITKGVALGSSPTAMANMGKAFIEGTLNYSTFGANALIKKLPVIGNILGGIDNFIMGGLFGKTKTSITGGGININKIKLSDIFDGAMVKGSQYSQVTEKTSSWFSSSSKSYDVTAPLNKEFRLSLGKIYSGMKDSMVELSAGLGLDINKALEDYVIKGKHIELRGLSSDAMIKKLNNVFSTQLDLMSTTLFKQQIGQYQKLGEGMFETAGRLVTEVAVVKDALSLSNITLHSNVIAISDDLIQLAGGIKQFQEQTANYYDKFYTDVEKQQNTFKKLSGLLGDYGIKLADTRAGYRKTIDLLDLSVKADRKKYDLLLMLSDTADAYYSYMETAAEKALNGIASKLRSTLDVLEPMSRDAAQVQLNASLAIARAGGGVNDATGQLSKALDVIANSSTDLFANYTDYLRDKQQSANKVAELSKYADAQLLGTAEAQLEVQKLQLEAENRIAELIKRLDPNYRDPVTGMGPLPLNGVGIIQLPAGTILNAGIPGGGVIAPELLAKYGSIPAFASGGLHLGGARIVGENGPELEVTGPSRITSASETKRLFDNSDLLAEIQALRLQVAELNLSNRVTAQSSKKTADLMSLVTQDGQTIKTSV